jgi:hypothetical protein
MKWAEHVAGRGKNAYRILVGKPEGKRPLGRFRHRWEDSISKKFSAELVTYFPSI